MFLDQCHACTLCACVCGCVVGCVRVAGKGGGGGGEVIVTVLFSLARVRAY